MEREKFIECRDEIVRILENSDIHWLETAKICASAINDFAADNDYAATVSLAPILDVAERQQTGISVLMNNYRGEANPDSFLADLKGFLERELKASSNL